MECQINAAAKNPQEFVAHCDALYHENLDAIAQGVKQNLAQKHIVMLSGPSASGKTTTAHKLAKALRQIGVPTDVISLDDFYLGAGNCPKREDGTEDYETVFALDVPLVNSCLKTLLDQGEATFPIFDFHVKKRSAQTKQVTLNPQSAVIIEGIHALNPILTDGLDGRFVTVYATAQDRYVGEHEILKTNDIRLIRRLVRDLNYRNVSGAETVDIWPYVCDGENKYVKPYRTQCDYYVNSGFGYEPGLYTVYLQKVADSTPMPQKQRVLRLIEKLAPFVTIDPKLISESAMVREFIGQHQFYKGEHDYGTLG